MKLGEYQELIYIKKVDFGVYLGETENAQKRCLLLHFSPKAEKTNEKQLKKEKYGCSSCYPWNRLCR